MEESMATEVTTIVPAGVHPPRNYSHAVRWGNLVFVSGQVAVGPDGLIVGTDDIVAQAEQVLQNLTAVLNASGSDLGSLIKLTVYLTDRSFRPAFNEARERHLSAIGRYPASTVVVVAGLADPNWLIEVEAIAAMSAMQ